VKYLSGKTFSAILTFGRSAKTSAWSQSNAFVKRSLKLRKKLSL